MHRRPAVAALLPLMAILLSIAGCGRSDVAAEPAPIRTPLPTFTPTPPPGGAEASLLPVTGDSLAAQESAPETATETPGIGGPVAETSAPAASTAPAEATTPPATAAPTPAPLPAEVPLAVINTELVNSRSGPDTTYPVVMVLGRGEEYDITGKSADGLWFRLCCVQGGEVWAMAEFVDSDGSTDALPLAQAGETSAVALATLTATAAPPQAANEPATQPAEQPTATPQPVAEATAAPAELTPTPATAETAASTAPLELVGQEQFPESNVVRLFAYVYAENDGLEGYSVRVTKDGVEQPAVGITFGGRPGLTWPIADDRQRFQNLKVEFPGVDAAGSWVVTVMKDGAPAGPAATFTLAAGDPNRELYVRYKRP